MTAETFTPSAPRAAYLSPITTPVIVPIDEVWYKDAIVYEARVRSFYDSGGDGIGDFQGLAEKLEYLHDLGITAVWLLPFYPSPLRDDGYDISDYTEVHPDCGTLEDFQHFLREAHRRNIKVITELVINHTSDQHEWFQRARRAPPGSRWRDFYVWSDSPDRYSEARIIFHDFEPSNWSWDPVAKAYYWHRFYAHQPDLNFEHPDVRRAVFKALDFWLGMGVDGLRLDAIPYLFEREGTNCENLPETHAFLKELRQHVDRKYRHRMLLAEANQWPEDAVAYFGSGDECHMSFHFPLMPRLFMALQMENRYPVLDILKQTPPIPETSQWALFLRNHDELTLEMVTDEERDYMYRVYAQDTQARINLGIRRRLAPLLQNDRRRIELLNGLLFSLPGTPFIYYGDEIGMGDNFFLGDRNGVRTPMQWSSDKNAGFSRANPQRLYLPVIYDPEYHYESVNVEAQTNNPNSLLRWMKRLIALRKRYAAFGRGTMTLLTPRNRKVLAFVRHFGEDDLLVIANLSGTVEYVELDLATFKGSTPIELFGHTRFPRIGDLPYLLTLGPYAFYWFKLDHGRTPSPAAILERAHERLHLQVRGKWEAVVREPSRGLLERALPAFMRERRWFAGKGRVMRGVTVADLVTVPVETDSAGILSVQVQYDEGSPETYGLPLLFATGEAEARIRQHHDVAILAELEVLLAGGGTVSGILCDALVDPQLGEALLLSIQRLRRFKGELGRLSPSRSRAMLSTLAAAVETADGLKPIRLINGEQSNSSILFDQRLILKLVRRWSEGLNPDLEIGRFLTEGAKFPHVAPVIGALEYQVPRRPPVTVGILHGFVPNEGDAWQYTLDQLQGYFERVLGHLAEEANPPEDTGSVLDLMERTPPQLVNDLFGAYLETARLLGQRTAELHLALASGTEPAFAPERFSTLYQRSLYQSMRNLTAETFQRLRERHGTLRWPLANDVRQLLDMEEDVLGLFATIAGKRIEATRIRCHGDYHLGQVLHTGRDFVIIDFEGEPARSLAERRLKRSPLRDVVGMVRSFDYAVHTLLLGTAGARIIRPEDVPALEPWARFWVRWVSATFLRAYLQSAGSASFIPQARDELVRLLRVLMLEKNVYEIDYELNNRPDWLAIPVHGILRLLKVTA